MRGFPPELFYVLFFIGILVFQFLMKRRAGRGQQAPTQDDDDDAPPAYEVSQDLGELMRSLPLIRSPAPSAATVETRRRPEPATPARARPPRRFARQSLFSNRRDVQNAVVIATILGPCRALEPPGEAAAAMPPQRAAPR
ncbi:hypothetical protein [Piscinibacter sp.]|uniref:hypothetical protein n=1 Tax=Piscinibacter sp. TaxID=1903157 RepID=UPI002CC8F46D|nr:hypothetical protein [Albitalea sp.]HUG26156.1 hypothetical protein [Albitalea sp.]